MGVVIRKIRSAGLLERAVAAAKADQHELVGPTHVVMREDEIVGAVTVMPCALIWMDTRKAKVRDSAALQEHLSTAMAINGEQLLCVPCARHSPYHQYLGRVGYVNLGAFDFFVKIV